MAATQRVICLAGSKTTAVVETIATERGLEVSTASSVAAAAALLSDGQGVYAVIVALGTDPSNMLFNSDRPSSELMDAVKQTHPGCALIVYSQTACSSEAGRSKCLAAGAGAVVCNKAALSAAMDELGAQRQLRVPTSAPVARFEYLPPGGDALVSSTFPPAAISGYVRVVCIADTHNEHESLRLPAGDLLIHAGDCLTASGTRHVERRSDGTIVRVLPAGEALFKRFAAWLGAQPHFHKVLIGGNHDLVIQGLGATRVQQILTETASLGTPPVYLEHEAATVGGLRVFGSPFAHYGGINNAFLVREDRDFLDMPVGCDIVVTHMPCLLPRRGGGTDVAQPALCSALLRTGASLHVSGHCHWAHGLYHTGRVPCVVASVCDSHWRKPPDLEAASGMRGDPADAVDGGYNVGLFPIVVDVKVPSRQADPSTNYA